MNKFFAKLGMKKRAIFRICDLFGTMTNRKLFLDSVQMCHVLKWKQSTESLTSGRPDGSLKTSNKVLFFFNPNLATLRPTPYTLHPTPYTLALSPGLALSHFLPSLVSPLAGEAATSRHGWC